MSDAFSLLKPGDVVGEFQVIEPLAEGGMGAVFVVRQQSTGRKRALKVLHPRMVADPTMRARFLAEAMVSAEIGGAHPVDVIACGVDPLRNIPWIAMELLEGETLDRRARRAPLSHSDCAALFRELGDVLDRAHRKGIVHRDLKPENLFLVAAPTNERGFVSKVLDFGIAAFVAQGRTAATGTRAMGTPLWMAPEQYEVRGKIRPATDVWSLGLIAFFALTGREFWLSAHSDGASVAALMAEIITGAIPPASERLRAIEAELAERSPATIPATRAPALLPADFDGWFARCVARDARDRFATGAEACAALVALLLGDRTGDSWRAQIEKTIPVGSAAPVVRSESGAEGASVTKTAVAPEPAEAFAVNRRNDVSPRAVGSAARETSAGLYAAWAFVFLGGLSALAWKALNPPAPAAERPIAAAAVTPSPAVGAVPPRVTPAASPRGERIHVAQLLIAHTHSMTARPDITRGPLEARTFAERLLRRANAGEDFMTLSRAHSDDPSARGTGGDLGFIARGQTIPAFERAAFALDVGQLSPVVTTAHGFHLIKRLE
jgi:serine/threonine-protein kinase